MKKWRQFLSQSSRVVNAKLVTFWHSTKNLSTENLYHRHFEITTAPLSIIEISKLRLRLSPKTLDKWLHDKKCFPPIKDASKKCLHRSSFERNFITLWKIDLQCAAFMSFSDSRFLLWKHWTSNSSWLNQISSFIFFLSIWAGRIPNSSNLIG